MPFKNPQLTKLLGKLTEKVLLCPALLFVLESELACSSDHQVLGPSLIALHAIIQLVLTASSLIAGDPLVP